MALKALMKMFGFGKEETKKTSPRYHPYDEISDDQLAESKRTPRVHPYDEVSDAVLEENRSKAAAAGGAAKGPVRRHNYDEIDLERTMSKVNKVTVNSEGLNYVEVELPKGVTASKSGIKSDKSAISETIYTDVRPTASGISDKAGAR